MASIRKRGSSYLIIVSRGYGPDGARIKPAQKTFHPPSGLTPKQVEKWLSEQAVLFEMETRRTKPPVDPKITLREYTEIWLRTVAPEKLALTTLERDKLDIDRFLPELGNYKLTDLTGEIFRDYYNRLRKTKSLRSDDLLSELTVAGTHATICSILSDAVEAGYLDHNPAWRAYKRKGKKKEKVVADEEVVKKIISALEQEDLKYEVYFKLVLATGMRRGECCGLRWERINWKENSIHICENVVAVTKYPVFSKEPKTSAGDRMVYFSDTMAELLRRYKSDCRKKLAKKGIELEESEFLFRRSKGGPMRPDTFTTKFGRILKKYDLPQGLTLHSLRHTNASILISEGTDIRTVASLLGHAQPSTTLDIYAHAFDKNKRIAEAKAHKAMGL